MLLSREKVKRLLDMISAADPDGVDCDGCLWQLAEFAELHLLEKRIPETMKAVEAHLKQCGCCNEEFNMLLEWLHSVEEDP